MKKLLLLSCASVFLTNAGAATAQDFLGNLARRTAERLAERAAAAAVASVTGPRSETGSATSGPEAGVQVQPASSPRQSNALEAWLNATPPAPAPGFTLMGTAFIYQDDIRDTDEGFNPDGDSWPGWGESEAEPVGERLVLPEGLELVGPFRRYNPSDPQDCDRKYENEAVGEGSLVQICLVLRNTTDRFIIMDLPPGLMFVSRSREVQNGLVMSRIRVRVPPGAVFFQPLFLHCANSGFSPSNHEEEGYDLGPIQNYGPVREVAELLANKQVDRWYFPIVSQAVTDLGDAGRISARTRRGLRALPDRR